MDTSIRSMNIKTFLFFGQRRVRSYDTIPPQKNIELLGDSSGELTRSCISTRSLLRNTGSSLVSPKRVVGCRGGSRYVEGCWGFPYLKIQLQNANFMFFIDIKFSKILKMFYGDLHHLSVPVFGFSTFRSFKNSKF